MTSTDPKIEQSNKFEVLLGRLAEIADQDHTLTGYRNYFREEIGPYIMSIVEEALPPEKTVRLARDCVDCTNIPMTFCRHDMSMNDYRTEAITSLSKRLGLE